MTCRVLAALAFVLIAPPAVPETDRRAAIDALERAQASLGDLGVGDITVQLYPDLASFVRGSRGAPSLAGRWRDGRLHLAPIPALKARGILESTVRHELAHRWVAERSGGRAPRWFEEGVCVWKAGETTASGVHEERRLPVSGGVRVSYAQAGRYVRALARRRGPGVIDAMLSAFARGGRPEDVFPRFAGEAPAEIRF